jgi:ComF family protein
LRSRKIKKAVLDTLFPIFCLACETEGFWLCDQCLFKIQLLDFQLCPACEANITEKGALCPACRESRKSSLDSLIVSVSYENPVIKKLIHNLKYRFVADIAKPLADLMVKALLRNDLPIPDYIMPIPLHPRRLRWRGFNQSLLLAETISENLAPLMKIEVQDILERQKYNQPQMKIKKYQERLENVKSIFGLKEQSPDLKNKTVLLVDDIATTGATLEECAKVIKEKGARKIFGVVISRQVMK